MALKLPMYCRVGARPVKAVQTPDGGADVLALDWNTGKFVRELDYLDRMIMGDVEVDYLTKEEFDAYVAELRQEIASGASSPTGSS